MSQTFHHWQIGEGVLEYPQLLQQMRVSGWEVQLVVGLERHEFPYLIVTVLIATLYYYIYATYLYSLIR